MLVFFVLCGCSLFLRPCLCFFFFKDTATTEIYTLSLHDALPILAGPRPITTPSKEPTFDRASGNPTSSRQASSTPRDRKSTRLNSSHTVISYAVFCLKKKNTAAQTDARLEDKRGRKYWQCEIHIL